MKKASSCITVYSSFTDAVNARKTLLESIDITPGQVSLIGKDVIEGKVAALGVHTLDEDLKLLGVQEGHIYCYKCMVYGGSFLLIVSGDYSEVEKACDHLEQNPHADSSIHFNSP